MSPSSNGVLAGTEFIGWAETLIARILNAIPNPSTTDGRGDNYGKHDESRAR